MKKHVIHAAMYVLISLIADRPLFSAENYWVPRGSPETDAGKMKTLEQVEPRTYISQIPYSITNPGSYYVINPLFGSPGGSNGITINASHVRLDLCGFALSGVPDSGSGVAVASPCDNICIKNGVICNWSQFGINMTNARDVVLSDVKAFGNSYGGIYAGDNAYLERCAAYNNGTNAPTVDPPLDDGIRVGSYSTVIGCKSRFNRGAGIHTYFHSRITECTSTESKQADGIHAENYCTIEKCTSAANFNGGITVAGRCRVNGNTCGENGLTNPATNACGIFIVGDNNIVEGNNLMGNNIGVKISNLSSGNFVVRNIAAKNGIDSDWSPPPPGNYVGPVEMLMGGAFTNTNPWSNFKVP